MFAAAAHKVRLKPGVVRNQEMMKTIIIMSLLVMAEIILIMLVLSPIFVSDQIYDQTFATWWENKTPENETVLKKEQVRIHKKQSIIRFVAAGLLAANTIGLLSAAKRIKKQ